MIGWCARTEQEGEECSFVGKVMFIAVSNLVGICLNNAVWVAMIVYPLNSLFSSRSWNANSGDTGGIVEDDWTQVSTQSSDCKLKSPS